ncbi:alkene reductase [Paraglaciecola chathamensis]|uniref:alkene reductase n=1 Tax=Paraglaciecola chathamensis TaxID=368405 RepID=UPI002701C912|nr:alkene reductase [Paraglaciecola chathamensis]MDO6558945.1 alkene reductase [Paraglaciecola chathamensis]
MSILFEPTQIGRYTVRNRIFMAPMSRYRASKDGINPSSTAEYYRQRASAGLIVAESTRINAWSGGINCPGIYTPEQVASWKKTTEAVRKQGGVIFLQLWHAGRAAHQSLLPKGREVVAPSAISSLQEVLTEEGMAIPTPPRALTLGEISELREDFAHATRNALAAGFDGVEIHAAGGFLIDTFLQETTNQRKDRYGGSLENRFRFLKEVTKDAIEILGADRVAVKLSPTSLYNDMGNGEVLDTFKYVISQLNQYGLAFLEVNEEMPSTELPAQKRKIVDTLRTLWTGPYIGNGNFTAQSGAERISQGKATAISYGRSFLANPDLPLRYAQNAALNELDASTLYGGDHKGYTDYPTLHEQ